MATIDSYTRGSFCWYELSTTDVESAKKLYSELFGWTAKDIPISPTDTYTIFQVGGNDAAAVCKLQPDQEAHGVPPNWLVYISVTSADESAAKAKELGGNILAGPFDVMDVGRMAVIQDPQGAVFALWQPMRHIGARHKGPVNQVCWCEVYAPDPVRAVAFYQGLFGWKTKPEADFDKAEYIELMNPHPMGGIMPMKGPQWQGVPPHWMIYVSVADCEDRVAKGKEMGVKVCVGPMDIPNVGKFAVLTDPQGATFSIIQLSAQRVSA